MNPKHSLRLLDLKATVDVQTKRPLQLSARELRLFEQINEVILKIGVISTDSAPAKSKHLLRKAGKESTLKSIPSFSITRVILKEMHE